MDIAQDKMREDYTYNRLDRLDDQAMFKTRLKHAVESGLLLFAKYFLVLILGYFALQFLTGIVSGSQNGTNSVLYLTELQNKGYLPKAVNGVIPMRNQSNEKP